MQSLIKYINTFLYLVMFVLFHKLHNRIELVTPEGCIIEKNDKVSELSFTYYQMSCPRGGYYFSVMDGSRNVVVRDDMRGDTACQLEYYSFKDGGFTANLDKQRVINQISHQYNNILYGPQLAFYKNGILKSWSNCRNGQKTGNSFMNNERGIRQLYQYCDIDGSLLTTINYDSVGNIKGFKGRVITGYDTALYTDTKLIYAIKPPYGKVIFYAYMNNKVVGCSDTMPYALNVTGPNCLVVAELKDLIDKDFVKRDTLVIRGAN